MKTETTHTHTQGPWYVARPKEAARNGSPILATSESVGVYFAHGSNGEANARLIAAAPDLLAELHAVRVQLEAQALGYTALEIWPHVRAESIRRISMTISKAEGNA
jgi:hypothetical protein